MSRRGWCPTVFAPMASGDGLLVRLKPPASRLTAAAASMVAEAAAAHGNGTIELTNRGNLQLRGLTPASVDPFARAMVAAGLASHDAAAERRRTVLLAPLAGEAASRMALTLEAALEQTDDLASLPAKFGFVVEGGPLPLAGVRADIRLTPAVGGDWHIASATQTVTVPAAGAATAAIALAGLASPPASTSAVRGAASGPPPASPSPNFLLLREKVAFSAAFARFGTITAASLRALAEIAERHSDGLLRLTPWRAFVLAGAVPPEAIEAAGLIADPADLRLALAACPGRPACASAHADTRADAARLARLLPGLRGHLSGCTKGCAHRAPAPLTLVARPDGYALVRHGTAADPPDHTGLTLDDVPTLLA